MVYYLVKVFGMVHTPYQKGYLIGLPFWYGAWIAPYYFLEINLIWNGPYTIPRKVTL